MRRSWLWLTAKYWAAQRLGLPLDLPSGTYVTDGKRLWRQSDDGREETQATNDPDGGDSGTSTKHAKRSDVRGAGHSGDAWTGQRNDGLRQLRQSDPRRDEDDSGSQPRVPLQQMWGVQRDLGLKDRIELAEDLEYRLTYLAQTGRWLSTGQRWIHRELAIHVHVTTPSEATWANKVNAGKWCVDFQAHGSVNEVVERRNSPMGLNREAWVRLGVHGDWHHHSVLVVVREIPKKPHRARLWPATVRLIPTDCCPLLRRNTGEPIIDPTLPGLEAFGHREIDVLRTFGTGNAPQFYEIPSQMIERGSEVLEGIPEGQTAIVSNDGDGSDPNDGFCCVAADLDLSLDGDGVSLRIKRPLQSRIKGCEVFLRPIELGPTTLKGRVRHREVALHHAEGPAKTANEDGSRNIDPDSRGVLP